MRNNNLVKYFNNNSKSRVFLYIWSALFGLLYLLIFISDSFLINPENDSIRSFIYNIIDLLLVPFPNSLHIILYGATSSHIVSFIFTGISGYCFFSYFGKKIEFLSIRSLILYIILYSIISTVIFYLLGYLFFANFFMQVN